MTALTIGKIHLRVVTAYSVYTMGLLPVMKKKCLMRRVLDGDDLKAFFAETIETNHTDFYSTIKKNNLKTFEEQKKIVTLKILNDRIRSELIEKLSQD